MARSFTAASSQSLGNAALTAMSAPLSVSCWFRANDITTTRRLVTLYRVSSTGNNFQLTCAGAVGGDPIQWVSRPSTTPATVSTTTGYSANVWSHACGVEASTTDRRVYLNGGSKGTDTASKNPGNQTGVYVGANEVGTGPYMDGRIAHVAVWNAALNDREVLALSLGVHPTRIRPGNLVLYWPLSGDFSPEQGWVGNKSLTLTGSPTKASDPATMPWHNRAASVLREDPLSCVGASNIPILTQSAVGHFPFVAVGASNIPILVGSSAGKLTMNSAGGSTIPKPVQAGAAIAAHQSTASQNIPMFTQAGAAISAHPAAGAQSIPIPTQAGVGQNVYQAAGASVIPMFEHSGGAHAAHGSSAFFALT